MLIAVLLIREHADKIKLKGLYFKQIVICYELTGAVK
jgi:hypothetical protein